MSEMEILRGFYELMVESQEWLGMYPDKYNEDIQYVNGCIDLTKKLMENEGRTKG